MSFSIRKINVDQSSVYLYFLLTVVACVISGQAFAQKRNPFGNALIPDMVADASIQVIDGKFYCYATTDGYDNGLKSSGPPVVWKSDDFVNWHFEGTYFPSALQQLYWAPSKAIKIGSQYFIYPTVNGFMYPAVANTPDGPFKLAKGDDKFIKPFSKSTLLTSEDSKGPKGIDAEIFIDDDASPYVFWQRRFAARLKPDMLGIDGNPVTILTPRQGYSEGPIFFKRKGIYYYLYTLGGNEEYQYAYVMSKVSPLGPWTSVPQDIITSTDYSSGVYGPGHGSVFNLPGTDHYYIAFLEYGRGGTNRQTYVNKLEFNKDGSIRPVKLTLNGVGQLFRTKTRKSKSIKAISASSVRTSMRIKPTADSTLNRTEAFDANFAVDSQNGSRWMADHKDTVNSLTADFGRVLHLKNSALYFVRPTAGHLYVLEYSIDGQIWKRCGGNTGITICSPHADNLNISTRYLRVRIIEGIKGVWEWHIN